jgi:AraC-like DNA-binding protein
MTAVAQRPAEHIGYRRSATIPGLEILDAYHSPREWRVVSSDYAVTFLRTWRGEVRYRGRVSAVERGIAFCNYPGEALIATPEANGVGSFNVLAIHEDLMLEWISERRARSGRPEWRGIFPRIPDELWTKFQRVSGSLIAETSALQLQSDAVELAEALVRSLIAGAGDPPPGPAPAIRGTARMRECLNEEGFDVDLETLARKAGMSKFQALRAFKRRYGLPPHQYQMCLRIATVRQLLLEGAAPADVAAHCGFVDQSHMNRHFKRIVGVTPMRYVASNAHTGVLEAAREAARHAKAIVQRGDRARF